MLQQNEAYCTQVQLQQNVCYAAATSASTNDKKQQSTDQVQLQQNECYAASRENKDKTDE